MSNDNKGKFQTDIAQNLIDAAMRSVDKAKAEVSGQPLPPEPGAPAASGASGEVEVPIEAPAAPDSSAVAKELEATKAMLEISTEKTRELLQKLKDEHERTLRAMADLENYKKRASKEREEIQRFGLEKMLKDFLPVVDNFDRALEHSKSSGDMKSLETGVSMVRKLFEDALARHGVKAFDSVGKLFDPNFHEAMGQLETKDAPANTVMKELVRGFTLNDRLVRPALVMVAKPPAPPPAPPAPAAGPDQKTDASPAPASDTASEPKS
ncbi:MAG: nucleotide exchange factor GrpE [Myxococcaceae bacterium]